MASNSDAMGKLVREGIPATIAASGRKPDVKTLDDNAYRAALLDKLDEETEGLRQADTPTAVLREAADVLEVLINIAASQGHTLDDMLHAAATKRSELGGFRDKVWLSIGAVAELNTLLNARYYGRDEVLHRPCPVPKRPGNYGWWFRRVPALIDTTQCQTRDGLVLLYTGISPSRPPSSGKPPSSQSLYHRIRYHYTGNAAGSTLRKTLGVLLGDELGIELRRVGSGTRLTFGPAGEAALSAWMSANAIVSWVVQQEPWLLEEELIANLDVPLNIHGNAHNRFYPTLKRLRADAVAKARSLPIA
ncbi:nucleoside triphosphate pyrophosphohydrolase [Mycolicibacterium sp. CBM1]